MKYLVSIVSGLLFGFGLALSQMTDPAKVLGFLDFSGRWDPTLALVLAGAALVSVVGFHFILRQPHPLLDTCFYLPKQQRIDRQLVIGAAIFGVGWGLAGLCPGPGIASLSQGAWPAAVFTVGLILGIVAHRQTASRLLGGTPSRSTP